ncbi:MAG: PQQ-binding-like beta-propeller repeat protein, partial [Sinomicrobium sp.]|nr:PQQ-binding-like beta-propeller repeat protein [Sinomicrobium sp.]
YSDPDRKDNPIRWSGPVLAAGRLIAVSTDGQMVEIQADTGKVVNKTKLDRSVTIAPIVAGDTLYLLSSDGTLMAYR